MTGFIVAVSATVGRFIVAASTTTSGKISSVVTADMMNGVLDEVISLLPVCIPVMISFIALRKGIGFIKSVLHSA